MVKMSESTRAFLEKHLPECLELNDPNEVIYKLDDLIVLECLDEEYDLTPLGRKARYALDDVYFRNSEFD